MFLQINEDLRITSDPLNIIVQQRKVAGDKAKNPGEETWVNISYHNTLEKAARWLFDHHMRATEASDLQTIVAELRSLKMQIAESFGPTEIQIKNATPDQIARFEKLWNAQDRTTSPIKFIEEA